MKTLNLLFQGSLGKKHLLKLSYANDQLNAQTVRQAMEQLAGSGVFAKDGEELYTTPLSAKYVDTIPTVLFNDEKKTAIAE